LEKRNCKLREKSGCTFQPEEVNLSVPPGAVRGSRLGSRWGEVGADFQDFGKLGIQGGVCDIVS